MIYLDNNATTQPLPEVVEAVLPFLSERYANPSSTHPFGQKVRHAIECARGQVAGLVGAPAKEVIFTSGGTESINLAIRGLLAGNRGGRHVVTTQVEHAAVLEVMRCLEQEDYHVDYVGVDGDGRIDEAAWQSALTHQTALASLIHANNETGVISDVARLCAMAAERGVPVHLDAVQSAGKLAMEVSKWPVALVSLSAHKFHGAKGVGALYLRTPTRLAPLIVGGGQERELRGGTENVAGIVGMGAAAEVAAKELADVAERVGAMRDRLERGLVLAVPGAVINGEKADRIATTTNISFPSVDAQALLILLAEAGIQASSGAACSSGSVTPSHVLQAMGLEEGTLRGAIRFSLSRLNTMAEIDQVVEIVPKLLARCPRAAPTASAGKARVRERV
jgi:cysteine desulfurase